MKSFKLFVAVLAAIINLIACASDEGCKIDGDCVLEGYRGVCKHPGDPLIGGTCNYYDPKIEITPSKADVDDTWDSTTDDSFIPSPEVEEDITVAEDEVSPPPDDGSPPPDDDGNVTEDPGDMDVPDTNADADAEDSTNTDGDVEEVEEVEIDTEEVIEPPKCVDADCDDDNPCTKDSCDPKVGCSNEPLAEECYPCTSDADCAKGVNNMPYYSAVCDVKLGKCVPAPDECQKDTDCDDGNSCTSDSCTAASWAWGSKGCGHAKLDGYLCEDGNPCTENDLCEDNQCVSGANECACTNNTDCAQYEDGDLCNGTLACEGNQCVVKEIKTCAASATPCYYLACVPASGQCIQFPDTGTACNDGSACTVNDTCVNGACEGVPIGCDDNNVCTDDACDPISGCTNTDNTADCDDENACTTNDTCLGGICQAGTPLTCDDGKLCNGSEICDPETGCQAGVPIPSCCVANVDCEDGSACTDDVCVVENGKCESTPVTCDDGDACTTETCNPTEGCTYDDVECNDGNPCTSDACIEGKCEFTSNSNPCDDGDACTIADHCKNGACAVKDVDCNDGNPCTDDSCDPTSGCAYAPNVASCGDGDACTTGDACVATVCESGPPLVCNDTNPCTDDACANGKCTFLANDSNPCDDGDLCTVGDACQNKVCVPGSPTVCTALSQCHFVGSCNPATGECSTPAKADGTVCTDSHPCTDGDSCQAGVCQVGSPLKCDDGNANGCSDDFCDPKVGCTYKVWAVNPPEGKCYKVNLDESAGDKFQPAPWGNDLDNDGDGICNDAVALQALKSNPDFYGPNGDGGPQSCTGVDNCPNFSNKDQKDTDGDGIGDACDQN